MRSVPSTAATWPWGPGAQRYRRPRREPRAAVLQQPAQGSTSRGHLERLPGCAFFDLAALAQPSRRRMAGGIAVGTVRCTSDDGSSCPEFQPENDNLHGNHDRARRAPIPLSINAWVNSSRKTPELRLRRWCPLPSPLPPRWIARAGRWLSFAPRSLAPMGGRGLSHLAAPLWAGPAWAEGSSLNVAQASVGRQRRRSRRITR